MQAHNHNYVISLQKVSKNFGDFRALNKVSLDIKAGERVVICGPSGSGKSTLIRCINQLEKHESGHIFVDGVELKVRSNRRDTTRARVGMVFQQFNLFPHLTVIENLMLGPIRAKKMTKTAAEKLAMRFLDRVHIPEQAKKYPRQLSGGQQQRVAIARSLCMEPEILLFDEPTSALDPEMISEVLEVMVDLAQSGITMICVTHEMGFARKVADRMVFMDHGEIVEASPPEKFFNTPDSERCQSFLQKILHH
jgi:ABC-type polar amino acid transport system ATPase subunit